MEKKRSKGGTSWSTIQIGHFDIKNRELKGKPIKIYKDIKKTLKYKEWTQNVWYSCTKHNQETPVNISVNFHERNQGCRPNKVIVPIN